MSSGLDYQASWTAQAAAAADIRTAVGALDDRLAEINGQTDALLALWENSDSESTFVERQTQWSQAALQIKTSLEGFAKAMDNAAATSEGTEGAAAKTMARGGG